MASTGEDLLSQLGEEMLEESEVCNGCTFSGLFLSKMKKHTHTHIYIYMYAMIGIEKAGEHIIENRFSHDSLCPCRL